MASLILLLAELLRPDDAKLLYSSSQFTAASNGFGAESVKGGSRKDTMNRDRQAVEEAVDVVETRVCVDLVWS